MNTNIENVIKGVHKLRISYIILNLINIGQKTTGCTFTIKHPPVVSPLIYRVNMYRTNLFLASLREYEIINHY